MPFMVSFFSPSPSQTFCVTWEKYPWRGDQRRVRITACVGFFSSMPACWFQNNMKICFNRISLMGQLSSLQWMENIPIYQEADEENFFVSTGETLISKTENKGEWDVIDGDCRSTFNWLNVLSDFADMNFISPKRHWKLKYFSNT